MLDSWLESIKSMGIFLICAQTLLHFKPKGEYEKYIKLLVSIMLLVQLLEPIGLLLGLLNKGELQEKIRDMEQKITMVQEQAYSVSDEAENIWDFLLQQTKSEMEQE